ncbi:hypothetical protein NP493_755g02016 [Ridgeia piscesae]|uniref:Uncharacterized protein n=1 Tax=Ridgeia piscesae TaxID=27915 RepID=A0AAD9KQJ0_RIDPI|nr:hypothetical protein NP493_755g02016 [Ridgeia piscesae]
MIFCLRQLQEKYIEQDPLYMVFVDFSKALDTVWRTGLWQLLRKYECPEKITTMIEALHYGMMANKHHLATIGGATAKDAMSFMLKRLFSQRLAVVYCWKGNARGKRAYRELKLK